MGKRIDIDVTPGRFFPREIQSKPRGIDCSMRSFLSLVFVGCAVGATAQTKEPITRPNIIYIDSDDHGFQLGCCGDPNARTPELDRFARENVLFTHAYVTQSSCSPSRSSVLTGLYPHQTGQIGLAHLGYRMRGDIQQSLPKLLASNGYSCAIIGKLHVAPFEPFVFPFSRFSDFHAPKDASEQDSPHVATRDWKRMVGAVQEFIDERKSPFFLYVNLFDPHRPFIDQVDGLPANPVGGSGLAPLFETMSGDKNEIAGYYNGVERLDAIFGKIREILVKNGVWENSLVVYWGDNGQPFDGAKATSSEGALRVPLIVHWPNNEVHRQVDSPVSIIDLFRTALEAAGVPSPDYAQGISLVPYLLGGNKAQGRVVYSERNAHGVSEYHPERVEYSGDLKVVVDFTKPSALDALDREALSTLEDMTSLRVFDVSQDPAETRNLAGVEQYRQEVKTILGDLQSWMKKTGDFLIHPMQREALAKSQAEAFSAKGESANMTLKPEAFTGAIPVHHDN